MDRLSAMQVFVEVADSGSLTRAAERLDMSRAMVSRYIATLERWLGARLLHRTTRRIGFSDPRDPAPAHGPQMLAIAAAAHGAAGSRTQEPVGKLRITTSLSFAQTQLTS